VRFPLAHHLAATISDVSIAGLKGQRLVTAIGILALVVGGYLFSLWAHPYTKCRVCNGGGRHRGAIFYYAFRSCRACGGSGQKRRLGAWIFPQS
jgi:hypothetical protein